VKPFIRPSTEADCIELAQTMCEADRTELKHLGFTPEEALQVNLSETITVVLNGKVVAMCGVVAVDASIGRIWMLSTDDTRRCTSLLRAARAYVKEKVEKHTFLTNIAWSGNTAHLKWIDWLGFHFDSIETYNGQKFIRFALHASQACSI
jgi:hypothetical protein